MYRATVAFLITLAMITIGLANLCRAEPIKIMPLGDSITQSDCKHNSYRRNLQSDKITTSEPVSLLSAEFEGTAEIVEKQKPALAPAVLQEVRVGRHPGFDRVVFEFQGNVVPGYHLEYIDRPVHQCGSGEVVEVAGDGWLQVRFIPAEAHNEAGEATIKDRERYLDLPILKELELICDFEAEVAWVLGVSSPNRYRVLELTNPPRLVVDVRH